MNKRFVVTFVIALAIAALASFFVYRLVGARMLAMQGGSKSRVITAAADIQVGTIIKASDLSTTEISGSLPKGAILKAEDAIGRGVLSNIYQGEAILESRLAMPGAGGGLAATISQGMRACAVKVDEVVGVAGFVTAGMRVDVIMSGNPPGEPNPVNGTEVKTLLQNIAVLSAGTDIQKDSQGSPKQVQVVNLLVTPQQAEMLSLASNQTHIQLVLRNPLDTSIAQTSGSSMANIFGSAAPAAVPVRQPHRSVVRSHESKVTPDSVEVINGAQRSTQAIGSLEEQK